MKNIPQQNEMYIKIDPQRLPFNILLADDDIDDRSFFKKALNEIPLITNLTTFNNGIQGMTYLKMHTTDLPDLLFLDLCMPLKTGFECLSEIKESKALKELPVIVLTRSFTRQPVLEDYLKATLIKMGADDYIIKPVDLEKLKAIIYRVITTLAKKSSIIEKINIYNSLTG